MTNKTPLLILDEPCNALSKQHREPFISFMRTLSRGTGLQVIFVTHDSEFAQGSDKVIEL
jgi:ABC-type lipoprotein export system ATPase subunit